MSDASTGAGTLRCLALSQRGCVYEGDVSVLDDGAPRFAVEGFGGERGVALLASINFEADGGLRQQVWSHEHDDRALVLILLHRRVLAARN
jgi:hypothetical protein